MLHACMLGHVRLFAILWTVVHETPLSWDSPGKNTGVSYQALLQGFFPIHKLNPSLLHCKWILYPLSHLGSPGPNGNQIEKEHGMVPFAFHLRISSRNAALRLKSGKMFPEPEVKSGKSGMGKWESHWGYISSFLLYTIRAQSFRESLRTHAESQPKNGRLGIYSPNPINSECCWHNNFPKGPGCTWIQILLLPWFQKLFQGSQVGWCNGILMMQMLVMYSGIAPKSCEVRWVGGMRRCSIFQAAQTISAKALR